MDFKQDLRTIAEASLDVYKVPYLSNEATEEIIHRWVNMNFRLISSIPRKVYISNKIKISKYDPKVIHTMSVIENKFLTGLDVNCHLSKGVFTEIPTDAMLCEWGINHLHLNTELDPSNPPFVKRSDKLLFVMVTTDSAYFIDIRDHGEDYVFAQKELLKIAQDNWPELIEPYTMKGLSIERESITPQETKMLRKAGVTVITPIGGKIYAPIGGGLTCAGTSLRVGMETDKLMIMARKGEEWARSNEQILLQDVQRTHPQQKDIDLHLVLIDKGFVVVDNISNSIFAFFNR